VNAVTEFTKRRNWAAKVVEELPDLLQTLDNNGRIKYVSPSAKRLTGYEPSELCGRVMDELLHRDDVGTFKTQFNEAIAQSTQLRVFYRFRNKNGAYTMFEAVGHAHVAPNNFAPSPDNQTPLCHAVFMMAMPYPSKNAALLDSFLERKMENVRLRREIAELQREEQDEAEELERVSKRTQEATPFESGFSLLESTPSPYSQSPGTPQGFSRLGPTASPFPQTLGAPLGIFRWAPTPSPLSQTPGAPLERRVSLESGTSESSAGIMHPSVGATQADPIEMLTGLRYQEGERSVGFTTGDRSPALTTGDVGIGFRTGEKRKRPRMVEEHVCITCGRPFMDSGVDKR
jgi:PAS domain S-box-containing protein